MGRWALGGVLVLALLGGFPGAAAARPGAVELKAGAGVLGQLPLIVADDGAVYVSAERLASLLSGSWRVTGSRARLSVAARAAHFTRNQAQVVLDGRSLTLDAPLRVTEAGWLIPEDFLAKGLARLAPGVSASRGSPGAARPAAAGRGAVALGDLRFRSYPSFTRVVVETKSALSYALASEGDEVRVRLTGLGLPAPRVEEIADGLVREIRLEPGEGQAVLRLALDSAPGEIKHFTLRDPARIVVDVYRPKEPTPREGTGTAAEPLRLIVLDPGHGGHDPGAQGPTGLAEKDVVLDVTLRVARMLEERLGVKVALTRSTDVFVPLRDRTAFANRHRADLFVSIHANAHPRSVSEGVETYFLSSEATDNDARQVAALENGVIRLESPAARQKFDALRSILWDLAQSEFQQESSFLAETVQDAMTGSLRLVNRGVKQAGFYVLGGAATPAILIEIGFLTNPKEERKLATSAYREAIARAIYAGLGEYKRRYDLRMRTAQTPATRLEVPR